MADPLGWRSDVARDENFGLDETTSWDEETGAEAVIEAFFRVPALPVFVWPCDSSRIEESIQFRTLITRFESGREQRRAKGIGRRRWRIRLRKDQADIEAIWGFYLARQGPVEPFWWEHPVTGEALLVRFAERLSRRVLWRAVHEVALELVEVR
ncbi:MAG: hypothetical protein BAA04_04885 [Firmicutes bacterium ZCTH02-B6]|nr:MAG: hypothetical protein BAA04_04885 [Firmicutes bacterium ZCTH02-B6]